MRATIQADLRDARLRLAADDLVTRRAEFAGATSIETTLRREHDEAAARLAEASAQLAAHEAAVASLSERTDAAQQTWFRLSALAERVSATVRIASERAQYLDTEPPPSAAAPDPDALEAQAEEVAEQERELLAELDEARAAAGCRPRRAGREGKRGKPKPNAPTWRRCGPKPTAAKAWPGWPAGWRPGARGSSRSTREWRDCRPPSRRPLPAPRRPRPNSRPSRAASVNSTRVRSASTSTTTGPWPRCDWPTNGSPSCRPPNAPPNAQVASLRARIDALAVGLARKDGAAWLVENRGGAGLFGTVAKLVQVHPGYETALAAVLGAAADAVAADSFGSARSAVAALKDADGGRAAIVLADWPAAPRQDARAPARRCPVGPRPDRRTRRDCGVR